MRHGGIERRYDVICDKKSRILCGPVLNPVVKMKHGIYFL